MFIVKFTRKDDMPDEEYYYAKLQDAIYHYSLFIEDDSGLYKKVEIFEELKCIYNHCFI